ncbi:MAG: VCBS repeat-containing protein [Bacteroidetes bacterium]|nr:VCBS repeat-containing protein [Bacteroidota bacterium]
MRWYRISSPVSFHLQDVIFSSHDSGIAYGEKILRYKNKKWSYSPFQPPVSINLLFPIDTQSFFISSITKYQESDLFIINGKHWNKIWHPLANTISAMYFTDTANGVLAGIGEVSLLINNQWQWLPSPTNEIISSVVIDKDSVIWALAPKVGLFKFEDEWTKIENTEKAVCFKLYEETIYVLGDSFLGIIDIYDSLNILSTYTELKNLTSFFVINRDEIIAIGMYGLIMQYKNGRWKQMESDVSEHLRAIWMINNHEGWITGEKGIILHYTSEEPIQNDVDNWRGFEISTILEATAKETDDEYGVVTEDFNKDGLVDIFTCGLFEANHLYINSGDNRFIDKAQQWKISGINSLYNRELNLGACAADFDNDGDPDLYVTVLNGKNKFYQNIRGEYFVEYSQISGGTGETNDRTNCVITGDVDNDGDLDIFITNENTSNRLYLNNGAGIFSEEVSTITGLETKYGGMGCCFGDIDNDNDLDLYVANWSATNILYRNLLQETGQLIFKNISDSSGVSGEVYSKSNAAVFADIDNDADLDLFVTNRKTSNRIYINNGQGMFTDNSASMLGIDTLKSYGTVIIDFNGDGYKDIYVSNVGRNVFYKNIEGKRFVDNTLEYGAGIEGYSTGSAACDFDNNGAIDLYVANYVGESSAILLNSQNDEQFIKVEIKSIKNNKSGIGTKIYVFKENIKGETAQLLYYTEITGGSGYASMNQRFLPIPVRSQDFVDIKVVFPMGEIKIIKHVKTGSSIAVDDETGFRKMLSITTQHIILYFKDPHNLLRLITWICVIVIIVITMIYGSKRYKWPIYYSIIYIILILFIFYSQFNYFEYRNIWLSTILPVLSVLILITLLYLYFERSRIKKAAIAEQEQTQKKLSRDLHDDLGSTVSTIGIYLTLIRYNLKNNGDKLNQLLDKTSELVNETATAITDMVWAVNPKPESLDNLILRINKNFVTLFIEEGTMLNVRSKMDMENIMLNYKVKQNMYLIIKEALNNVLKYADALKVEINIKERSSEIHLSIKDNGIGFDISALKSKGHGITNMRIRAEEIKARFQIRSVQLHGTEIDIFFKPD